MTILQILWFFLIFVLIAGYFVLDGFDLGAGVLYPVLAKDETERAYIRRSIGPVWDGNEVWRHFPRHTPRRSRASTSR